MPDNSPPPNEEGGSKAKLAKPELAFTSFEWGVYGSPENVFAHASRILGTAIPPEMQSPRMALVLKKLLDKVVNHDRFTGLASFEAFDYALRQVMRKRYAQAKKIEAAKLADKTEAAALTAAATAAASTTDLGTAGMAPTNSGILPPAVPKEKEYEEVPPCTVIYCDLNHFKGFNDELTHEGADQLIKAVAKYIAAELGHDEKNHRVFVARPNAQGDEFIVFMQNTNWGQATKIMNDLSQKLYRKPFLIRHAKKIVRNLSISYGCYTLDNYPEGLGRGEKPDTVECALVKADQAMMRYKKGMKRILPPGEQMLFDKEIEDLERMGGIHSIGKYVKFHQPQFQTLNATEMAAALLKCSKVPDTADAPEIVEETGPKAALSFKTP